MLLIKLGWQFTTTLVSLYYHTRIHGCMIEKQSTEDLEIHLLLGCVHI